MIKFKCKKDCLFDKVIMSGGKMVKRGVFVKKGTVIDVPENESDIETNAGLKHFECLEPSKLPKKPVEEKAVSPAKQEDVVQQEKSSKQEESVGQEITTEDGEKTESVESEKNPKKKGK